MKKFKVILKVFTCILMLNFLLACHHFQSRSEIVKTVKLEDGSIISTNDKIHDFTEVISAETDSYSGEEDLIKKGDNFSIHISNIYIHDDFEPFYEKLYAKLIKRKVTNEFLVTTTIYEKNDNTSSGAIVHSFLKEGVMKGDFLDLEQSIFKVDNYQGGDIQVRIQISELDGKEIEKFKDFLNDEGLEIQKNTGKILSSMTPASIQLTLAIMDKILDFQKETDNILDKSFELRSSELKVGYCPIARLSTKVSSNREGSFIINNKYNKVTYNNSKTNDEPTWLLLEIER